MKNLNILLTELENNLPFIEQKKESVSKASVGWHLEHSLLGIVKMITAVEHSDPADYKREFNIKRTLILMLNKFPRGRAKAPESVKPGKEISTETITPLIAKATQKAELFETLRGDKFFRHPVFGNLRKNQARRIIAIHTNHHLKIINDILKE